MHESARRGRDLRGRHTPGVGRGRDQHGACGATHLTHRHPVVRGGGAAAGRLRAVFRGVQVALLNPDVRPFNVELLGDEHREHDLDALSDLRVLRNDGGDAVAVDCDERVRIERCLIAAAPLREHFKGIKIRGEHEAAPGQGRDLQKTATVNARECEGAHLDSSVFGVGVAAATDFTAWWIPWRMRM